MPVPFPTIDTHVHVWSHNAPWMAWLNDRPANWEVVRRDFTWEQLSSEMQHNHVEEVILVQAGMTPAETHQLMSLAANIGSVRGVVGWCTLTSAAAAAHDLDSFSGKGADKLVGVRNNHLWHPDGDILATAAVHDALRVLAERRLTLDLHFPDETYLPLALTVAEAHPDLRLIIDHLGKPQLDCPDRFEAWNLRMTQLAEHPNVFVKYSGWATFVHRTWTSDVRPYIDAAIESFGADRIMYGSNWPVALVAGSYSQTLDATLGALEGLLPSRELQAILHDTAVRCYLGGCVAETTGGTR